MSQPTTIRLPKELKLWLKKLAKREGRTFSGQLIFVLAEYRIRMAAVDRMLAVKK